MSAPCTHPDGHFWDCPDPAPGDVPASVCRRCGEERVFPNYFEKTGPWGGYNNDVLRDDENALLGNIIRRLKGKR